MFSKFKVTSLSNAYSTHFPLEQLYEAEIRRLRSKNEVLKLQNSSLVIQLNAALAQLHQQQGPFKSTQKGFFQLSKAARNSKKRKIKSVVIQSVKALEEFVLIEVSL